MASRNNAESPESSGKSVRSMILDTSPILNSTPSISTLLAKCEKLYTVPAIVDEVKDIDARSRFETIMLPFLIIRSPKPDSIKFVSDFSRRTGDYSVLSKPDIQVLALAYELDCEQNGSSWTLRKAMGQKGLQGSSPKADDTTVKEFDRAGNAPSSPPASLITSEIDVLQDPSKATENDLQVSMTNSAGDVDANETTQALENLQVAESSLEEVSVVSTHREPLDLPESNLVKSESESEDSDGWITPSNLKKQQAKDENASMAPIPKDQYMQVATITGDFAMQVNTQLIDYALNLIVRPQNVLLQIGLNLLSTSLQRVKHIRTYILRCHACFEKVRDMSKQFCPRCGKPTLTRVSCSTNQKGEFKIHLKKNMQWNHRGDRFSIPKPVSGTANGKSGQGKGGGKGGWGQDLILAEDQKEYLRATSGRNSKQKNELMDEDYLPGLLTGERARNGGRPKIGAGRNVNSKRRTG